MKKTLLAILMASAFAPAVAMAEQGDWVVRLRAANISPDEDSNLSATVGGTTLTGELTVDSNTIPEFDISYYVTKNIALELILAFGSKHDVNLTKSALNGASTPALNENLGEVNVLPPTLTVQWHFNPDQMIDPYVGAGVNYTRFMDKNLKHSVGGDIDVDRNSFGLALQAGVDINLKDGWLLNADVKKLWIDTDVHFSHGNGLFPKQKIDSLDIDPWVFAVGFGKKF
ncbi:MAG: OmpW family protein [Methylophilaceae bacterium]|jgi:outer membrane protein